MIIKGSVLLPRFISRPPKKSLSDSRTDSASVSDTDHKSLWLQLKIFYLSLLAKLFMIRPIASLEQRRRKRIHHNILSGVVDRAELIRGRPKAAIDSIRGGNEEWMPDGWIWWASINNISTIPWPPPRFILTVRSIDRSIEESIDIKNAIMVQFSPNRIFTAAIILLRYAPHSLPLSVLRLSGPRPAGSVACAWGLLLPR